MKMTCVPKCPHCADRAGIRKVVFGGPIRAVDPAKFVLCEIEATLWTPRWVCVACGWLVNMITRAEEPVVRAPQVRSPSGPLGRRGVQGPQKP